MVSKGVSVKILNVSQFSMKQSIKRSKQLKSFELSHKDQDIFVFSVRIRFGLRLHIQKHFFNLRSSKFLYSARFGKNFEKTTKDILVLDFG